MIDIDVGDRVLIDTSPDSVIVKEFGLMTTIFLKGDGKEIYAPNSVISTKFIYNIRRSGPLFEEIVLEVPLFTPFEKLEQLKNYLVQYIDDKESRELVNEVTITIKELKTNMSVGVGFKHKTNGQLLASKSARKSRFLLKIRDGLELCGIQLVAEVA